MISEDIGERPVGSESNRKATKLFKDELSFLGWDTEALEFDAIEWKDGGATLDVKRTAFEVFVSPYSTGCTVKAPLAVVTDVAELENGDFRGKIILLHGNIANEQLMPKNFVFYNPEHHRKIISLLENSGAKALICATGRNASLTGDVYPFPLIEDGDFDIPSVYTTEEAGEKLAQFDGKEANLVSNSGRIPKKAYNVTGKKGDGEERIVVTAHIDSKTGTPGATDNATGIVILLLLADLLRDYAGSKLIEIVAFNGEDYYSAPGQMKYIEVNKNNFNNVFLNINIDGAGYREGKTTFSFFDLPGDLYKKTTKMLKDYPEIIKGPLWPQGDHSIFVQHGRPAIAVSSQWFVESNENRDITHTPKDNIEIVDCSKLVEIASVLHRLILKI